MKKTKIEPTPDDIELFRNAVKGTTPLKQDKVVHNRANNTPIGKQASHEYTPEPSQYDNNYIDSDYAPNVGVDEKLAYAQPGMQPKMFKKLRKGQIPVQARLDLHGLTATQAAQRLKPFLSECHEQNKRGVLVIHGRGQRSFDNKPVLKSQVNAWLRSEPLVLAFCSARPHHGGNGAVYIWLKQSR